jgi:phosphoribosylaminoimidazole-succinocarboxamide synthase
MNDKIIYDQLPFCLNETDFKKFGPRYVGKVRDCYRIDKDRLLLITSDRLSCFDRVVTSIPFKGQILNQMAIFWLKKAEQIMPTHFISSPHPNVTIGKAAETLPVEVVVRGYITGSAWKDYCDGKSVSGVELPKGLRKNQKLQTPIITPSTKAAKGEHDLPISEAQIVSTGLVSKDLWEQVRQSAFKLFDMGSEHAKKQGLILVDTKYEFGLFNGELILIDEIHTLDCSRYWMANEYDIRFESGQDQAMLDKQIVREWLLSVGFSGDGPIPHFDEERRVNISKYYMKSFSLITGLEFVPISGDALPAIENISY